ncbi:MAG: hypothetical protein K6G91_09195 [Kiritimatiellae bacterium]|nr:hypothetical protein [Kiritimatiellia bacterium]
MVTRLYLQNFKIGERRTFSFDSRISVVEGDIGASRALAIDAFRLLLMASRNEDTASFPSSWIAASSLTRLSVSIANYDFPELTYTVTMRRSGSKTQILDEQVSSGQREILTRSGGWYHAGPSTTDRRRIDDTRLAFTDAARYLPEKDPIHDMRKELQELWLVAPDAFRMGSVLNGEIVNPNDGSFSHLATYIAVQAYMREAVRLSIIDHLKQLQSAGITGFSAKGGEDGSLSLVVHHSNDLDADGVPFGRLDNSEKMLFLAAFVCAVNEHSFPLSVVWDSPTNWLGGRGGTAVVKMLRRSFGRRGQLVMLA